MYIYIYFIAEWMSSILCKGEEPISISLLLPPFSNEVVKLLKITVTWFISNLQFASHYDSLVLQQLICC